MSLQDTPRASRLHIGIFGKRNSGKSSVLNALTGQEIAVTSDVAGTTTDPVYKSMEIHGLGPVVWVDTAGYDDVGDLGSLLYTKQSQLPNVIITGRIHPYYRAQTVNFHRFIHRIRGGTGHI